MRDRYSVYVDDSYSFSLSETALLDSKLHNGMELTREEAGTYKKLSVDDKLYSRALRYVAMRQRTVWEVSTYLDRKGADASLSDLILNKLSMVGLLDDEKYAQAYIGDRQLLRPTSRRKIIMELKKKRVPEDIVQRILLERGEDTDTDPEKAALAAVIVRKRRQSKYQDDEKLMQYLARQGFSYSDIKNALSQADGSY